MPVLEFIELGGAVVGGLLDLTSEIVELAQQLRTVHRQGAASSFGQSHLFLLRGEAREQDIKMLDVGDLENALSAHHRTLLGADLVDGQNRCVHPRVAQGVALEECPDVRQPVGTLQERLQEAALGARHFAKLGRGLRQMGFLHLFRPPGGSLWLVSQFVEAPSNKVLIDTQGIADPPHPLRPLDPIVDPQYEPQ